MNADWLGAILNAKSTQSVALGGIVTLVILSIIRGWLLPSAIVKQMIAFKDKIIEGKDRIINELEARLAASVSRGDAYKDTVDQQLALIAKLTDQNGKLITSGDAADHYFRELARVTQKAVPRTGGRSDERELDVVAPTD